MLKNGKYQLYCSNICYVYEGLTSIDYIKHKFETLNSPQYPIKRLGPRLCMWVRACPTFSVSPLGSPMVPNISTTQRGQCGSVDTRREKDALAMASGHFRTRQRHINIYVSKYLKDLQKCLQVYNIQLL